MMLRCPLMTFLFVLCLMCVHCNLAKPTNSMTRIQEVFRTLMGPKPMMLASRGKKADGLRGENTFPESAAERPTQALGDRNADSFWVVADERVPVAVLRNDWTWPTDARRRR